MPFLRLFALVALAGCTGELQLVLDAPKGVDGGSPMGMGPDGSPTVVVGEDVEVTVRDIGPHSAVVEWTSEQAMRGRVRFDLAGWAKMAEETTATTTHRIAIDRMMSDTDIVFEVVNADDADGPADARGMFRTASLGESPLAAGWSSTDVGLVSTELPGSARVAQDGSFVVRGTGTDVYNVRDSFHFVYQPVAGDFELTLRVDGYYGYLDKYTKAMTMFRADLSPGSPMFNQSINYNDLDYLYYRQVADTEHTHVHASQLHSSAGAPLWARLRRVGNTFYEELSADGISFTPHGPAEGTTVPLPATGLVGFGVCSKSNRYLSEIIYSQVTIR